MIVDNLRLLESLFLPEYRHKLPDLLKTVKSLRDSQEPKIKLHFQKQFILMVHDVVEEIKNREGRELKPDLNYFALLLLSSRKALLNRLKVFEIGDY